MKLHVLVCAKCGREMRKLQADLSQEHEKVAELEESIRELGAVTLGRYKETLHCANEDLQREREAYRERAVKAEKERDEAHDCCFNAAGLIAEARRQERQWAAEIVRSVGLGLCTYCEKHPIHYTCGLRLLIIKRILEGQPEGEGQQEKRE